MGTLLYFALFAGLFFLMMRFGCGAHVMGHHHGRHEAHERPGSVPPVGIGRWVPPTTAIDPVCGMTVATETSKSSVHNGTVYYFCSGEHREQFEADPGRYAAGSIEARALEHHDG
jgi:YHS domain-containing protein